jgi:voltage-gated potassium channel
MHPRSDRRARSWERATEWPLTVLALCYLAAYAVPILVPTLSPGSREAAELVMWLTWALFAADYVVRLALAEDRLRFIRRHLLDAIIIALPLLRPLRVLRLVTVLRVLNRHATGGLLGRVATYVATSACLLAFIASLAELDAERHNPQANITSVSDAVWWSVTTMTTVGYGDRYPTTTEGRVVAIALMLAGIALLGMVTATVAAWFVRRVQEVESVEEHTRTELDEVLAELRELRAALELKGRLVPPA